MHESVRWEALWSGSPLEPTDSLHLVTCQELWVLTDPVKLQIPQSHQMIIIRPTVQV